MEPCPLNSQIISLHLNRPLINCLILCLCAAVDIQRRMFRFYKYIWFLVDNGFVYPTYRLPVTETHPLWTSVLILLLLYHNISVHGDMYLISTCLWLCWTMPCYERLLVPLVPAGWQSRFTLIPDTQTLWLCRSLISRLDIALCEVVSLFVRYLTLSLWPK